MKNRYEKELSLIGARAKEASKKLGILSSAMKNKALHCMADCLEDRANEIINENSLDIEMAAEKGVSKTIQDRLLLNKDRITEMAEGLRAIASLDDPIGEVMKMWTRPNGIQIGKARVPLGVVGIIYEARPNVTVDAAGLCLKSGNAIILRGSSEAIHSNIILTRVIREAATEAGIPEYAIQLIELLDREAVHGLLRMNTFIDVLIPRGGAGLIQTVVENATVPVIETGVGNCHVYVDSCVNLDMAQDILINAKCQRPSVCNAAESLLVHGNVAEQFLPKICRVLQAKGVEIRGCEETRKIVPGIKAATENDYREEFLDLILAVKVVGSIREAVDHIHLYGTHHSEVIVTENYNNARMFLKEVDSAAVYVNTSTRFTDGFQFGFGAEIGISTQKLHARGPMGLEELTTTKYIVYGEGQIRS